MFLLVLPPINKNTNYLLEIRALMSITLMKRISILYE